MGNSDVERPHDEEEHGKNSQPVHVRQIKKILRFRCQRKTASQKKGQASSPDASEKSGEQGGMEACHPEPPLQERPCPKEPIRQPPATGASRNGLGI